MRIAPPIGDLSNSFREDLEKYMAWLQRDDPLADDAAPPLASATLKHRRAQILRFVGELVLSGIEARAIHDLKCMTRPDMAYRGLNAMLERKGRVPSGMIHGMAYTILIIAKYYAPLPDDELQRLRTACARLKPLRRGMTDRIERASGPSTTRATSTNCFFSLTSCLQPPERTPFRRSVPRLL